jgi:osmotically-inducible protein OsmY
LDSTTGDLAFEAVNGSDVAIFSEGAPVPFEFGADDSHNWQARGDERIKLAVMTALHFDVAVPRDRVRVTVSRGWVTLTGRVARDCERSRAEADAAMCVGVTGVTNRLSCEASK